MLMKKKAKTKSKKKLVEQLDRLYSKYIRLKEAKDGWNTCFTCGAHYPVEKLQCGHYHSRRIMSLRWDDLNCHPQCVSCNMFKEGNKPIYAIKLIEKYGEDILEHLFKRSNKTVSLTNQDLEIMIDKYKIILEEQNE